MPIFSIFSVGISVTSDSVLKLDFIPLGDEPKTTILLDEGVWRNILNEMVQSYPNEIMALKQMLVGTISVNTAQMIEVAPKLNEIQPIASNFPDEIKSFGELLAETPVADLKLNQNLNVEIELCQGTSITFTQDMWHNFQHIMGKKYARILQVAERNDHMSEINSCVSLFTNDWFIGLHPISRYSLIWDFNRYEDTSDPDSSEISQDDQNDTLSADVSSSSSDDGWCDPISPTVLERRLFDLYNNKN